MLLYCLFLRSAPHQSEANIFHCTKIARPPIVSGATRLHWVGQCRYQRLNKAMTVPEWQMTGRKKPATGVAGGETYRRRWRKLISSAAKPNSAVSAHSGQLPVRA
ncbi:hypothetical protein FZ928_14025 [Klebsiella pneumoniae]|uniref:Uncharacterized protein n=1 Tax=Klebsiella pneumoniae TaxID=573 RepID=A0A5C2LJR3_KLEPN|nr:hypothetical protein FZ928_14025 [Klebsiella pneumoniae]